MRAPGGRESVLPYTQLSDKEWMTRQYVELGLSTVDIACLVGCEKTAPLRALKRLGIPIRSPGGPGRRREYRIDAEGRECSGPCGRYLPWECFSPSAARQPGGRQAACRECRSLRYEAKSYKKPGHHRKYRLEAMGITQEEFDWLFSLHQGNCHIHGGPELRSDYRSGRTWTLSVDHDHSCCSKGRACRKCIRGLLCADCNTLLGLAERVGIAATRFSDYIGRRPLLLRGGEVVSISHIEAENSRV